MRKIKKIISQYQDVILVAILLAVAVLGIIFGLWPAGQRTMSLAGQVNDAGGSVANLRQKSVLLDSLSEADLQQELTAIVSAVPTDKSIPAVFQVVDALSAQTGVAVADMSLVSPGTLATGAAQKQTTEEIALGSSLVPFSVQVTGSSEAVHSFLSRITSVRRLVRLRNFDISFTGASGSAVLRMNADAFYAPLPSLKPGVEQKLPTFTSDENTILTKLAVYPWLSQSTGAVYGGAPGISKTNPFAH